MHKIKDDLDALEMALVVGQSRDKNLYVKVTKEDITSSSVISLRNVGTYGGFQDKGMLLLKKLQKRM